MSNETEQRRQITAVARPRNQNLYTEQCVTGGPPGGFLRWIFQVNNRSTKTTKLRLEAVLGSTSGNRTIRPAEALAHSYRPYLWHFTESLNAEVTKKLLNFIVVLHASEIRWRSRDMQVFRQAAKATKIILRGQLS